VLADLQDKFRREDEEMDKTKQIIEREESK